MEELARESISLLASASAKCPLDPEPRLGSVGAVFIMLKSALGAGLLNFPWAFERAGGVRSAVTVELVNISALHTFLIFLGFSKNFVLGTLAATYLTVGIIIKYYTRPAVPVHSTPPLLPSGFSSWASMFSVIPTICFGFQCHEASVAIYSSMENQRLSHWVFVSVVAMIICLIIYSLTGVYGYLTFGRQVEADILMSYASHDVLMLVARLLFGVSIITIYPIIVLLGRSVIQDPLLSRWQKRSRAAKARLESRSRFTLTAAWITVTLLIAVFIPDISKVIGVIGGISAFFIFIFPGLCLVFAMRSEPVSCKTRVFLTVWGMVTLICGAFIFGQSTTVAIMQLLGHI
ncbi:putative sodium-coupled neutral amino acid transporter 8a [Nematolebias whitei]|uniref:putative sodium-coupled neutral amino acid transporter 8a n=1 Tax=Nematolebias whitei TaxID=451745 RepID=UPI00189A00DC|nr:putative sodium-coupled neutral amino acid transporter 8a [Nematolebias whitei]